MKTFCSTSLKWLDHINLFTKTEQKRIKSIIVNNLNSEESISLDWFVHEKYMALFNGTQQTNIEDIIINSYRDFTFEEEYYDNHPLRLYMLYPLGFKGNDDLTAFGPRVFDIAWKIAEVGKLEDTYF